MKISQEAVTGANSIRDYGNGFLVIQTSDGLITHLTQNALITPSAIITTPPVNPLEVVDQTQIEFLKKLNSDVLIIIHEQGLTLECLKQIQQLTCEGIATEVMQQGPACRTFNLLITEGRQPLLLTGF